MKEAIIYGGAFNPPTMAHLAILQACVDRADLNRAEVWLLPSGERSDKAIGLDLVKRLKLAQALCSSVINNNDVSLKVRTLELEANGLTQTYDTQNILTEIYPEYTFRWVFGSDSVGTMKTWENGEWLFNNLGMLVIPRPGEMMCEIPDNAEVLQVDVPEISSTLVRSNIAAGITVAGLVPDLVIDMLR